MSTRQAIEYEVWENTPLENHQCVGVKTTRDHFDIWFKSKQSRKTKNSEANTDV